MFSRVFLLICTVAALASIAESAASPKPSLNSLLSPCPETFRYEEVDKPGQWSGSLIVKSDYDLHGVWIRLIFDKEVKDLTVDLAGFNIRKEDPQKRLIKVQNPHLLLEAQTVKILKITVTYDGTEVPSLIEYRLNARTACPQANIKRQDVFLGDINSDYFLPSLNGSTEIIPKPTQYKCGVPHVSNPHPWQATLYVNINREEKYICEATLISPDYILTAAHCVTFKKDIAVIPRAFVTVYLGQEGASKNAVRSLVADIQIHPGYEAGYLVDDVALLKLVSPVQVSDLVRPICLGDRQVDVAKAVVIGHEYVKNGEIGKLLESNVLMVDIPECIKIAPYLKEVLTYETYCLSYKSDDKNCIGNSGSGLISSGTDGVAILDGIVVLGVRLQNKKTCDANTLPVVTAINRYLPWIKHIIY